MKTFRFVQEPDNNELSTFKPTDCLLALLCTRA